MNEATKRMLDTVTRAMVLPLREIPMMLPAASPILPAIKPKLTIYNNETSVKSTTRKTARKPKKK